MIVLNGTLCSNNFRKVGLVQSFVNLATQILCLTILFKVVIEAAPHKRGYYIHGHKIQSSQEKSVTHTLIDIMFFIVIDIIAYLWLIFGLLKRKQSILTGWLVFSIMELIVVQISLSYFSVYLTITSRYGSSVLVLIIPISVVLYMIYNICVIYTVRHEMIKERNASLTFNSRTLLVNPSAISYPGYRIPHAPYLPSSCHASTISSCDLHGVVTSTQESTSSHSHTQPPPPYKVLDK